MKRRLERNFKQCLKLVDSQIDKSTQTMFFLKK